MRYSQPYTRNDEANDSALVWMGWNVAHKHLIALRRYVPSSPAVRVQRLGSLHTHTYTTSGWLGVLNGIKDRISKALHHIQLYYDIGRYAECGTIQISRTHNICSIGSE